MRDLLGVLYQVKKDNYYQIVVWNYQHLFSKSCCTYLVSIKLLVYEEGDCLNVEMINLVINQFCGSNYTNGCFT